jgi:hypothetical protein
MRWRRKGVAKTRDRNRSKKHGTLCRAFRKCLCAKFRYLKTRHDPRGQRGSSSGIPCWSRRRQVADLGRLPFARGRPLQRVQFAAAIGAARLPHFKNAVMPFAGCSISGIASRSTLSFCAAGAAIPLYVRYDLKRKCNSGRRCNFLKLFDDLFTKQNSAVEHAAVAAASCASASPVREAG